MAEEQIASEPSASTPAAKTQPPPNPVRRLTLIVMAVGVVLFLYGIAADRITPYTAQALVQASLVKIAPEVSGRVIEIGVGTDQRVEGGKILFRIEPDQYVLAVRRAEAQLETVGQSIGASTAAAGRPGSRSASNTVRRGRQRGLPLQGPRRRRHLRSKYRIPSTHWTLPRRRRGQFRQEPSAYRKRVG